MKRRLIAFLAVLTLALGASTAVAASQVIVTPSNQQGWSSGSPYAETRDGGTVTFVADSTAPGSPNRGALELTTPLLPTSAKAQYMHATATLLATVTELGYWTKQVSATFPMGDPSYQLQVCLNGATATGCNPNGAPFTNSSFTTLVFEPYQNTAQGLVVNNVWQSWDVDQGLFWSTRTVQCSSGLIAGTPGGPAAYTLAQVRTRCPNAIAVAFGVDIGSNNPAYVVRTDLVDFNGTVYNFEPDSTKPGCSDGQGSFQDRGNHGGDGPKTHECKNGNDKSDNNEDGQDSED